MIDINHKYQTRGDERVRSVPVRILCVDGPEPGYPVTGFVVGRWDVHTWTSDGTFNLDDQCPGLDLIPVPTKHEGWAAIWDDTYGFYVFLTKGEAVQYLHKGDPDGPKGGRIIPVTWES